MSRRTRAWRSRGPALAVAAGVALAALTAHHGPAGAPGPAGPAGPVPSNEQLANTMAAGYGWAGTQEACLDRLWTRENAAWDPTRWNLAGSGAYGIPQALPAAKMAAAGPDWQTSPATQIKWGLGYIRSAYGTPCNAWAHETADGWY